MAVVAPFDPVAVNQRNQKHEEQTDVKDECNSLDMRKYSNAKNVHKYGSQEYHPVNHCSMPTLRLIVIDIEDNKPLDHETGYKSRTSADSGSRKHGKPA
ncbi:MAG: hypothetical protein Q9167_004773 [Letrouitia subvulpina]